MSLGPRPYYWANTETVSFGSSPPIATRTGWMALACTPFMILLSAKANAIATMTGVSHERLIVFHTWVGWAMLVLALIHTFPFIVYHIQIGDMVEMWNTRIYYWFVLPSRLASASLDYEPTNLSRSGVAALIPQAYLTVFSLPSIRYVSWEQTSIASDVTNANTVRNAYYEFFKATHYFAALLFMLFFFFHCNFRLTSWYASPIIKGDRELIERFPKGLLRGCRRTLPVVASVFESPNVPRPRRFPAGFDFKHVGRLDQNCHPDR